MNKIELKVDRVRINGKDIINLVGIYIDGKNLADIVHEFEKQKKFDDYLESYVGDAPKFFIQKMQFDYAQNIVLLLGIMSGTEDDWPIGMNYKTEDGKVIWYGFHQPWRNDPEAIGDRFWDYSDFPKFIFDKKAYREQIKKIYDYCFKEEGKEFLDFLNKTSPAVREYNDAGFVE